MIKRAAFYSFANHFLSQLIGLGTIVIIARKLSPEELGVYAIASASIFLAMEIQNLGTSNYLIREPVINEDIIRRCYGTTLLISWAVGLIIVLASKNIAEFYQINDLHEILLIFSITFFLSPLSLVPRSILQRELLFNRIFYISITNRLASFLTTIVLIEYGFSYFSMAYGQVCGTLIALALNFLASPITPPLIPSFKNLSVIAKSGTSISIANALERICLLLPDFTLGKLGTTTDVAYFSRGVGYIDFIKNILTRGLGPITLPYLSKMNRENQDVELAYIKTTFLMGSFLWPTILVAAATAEPAIRLFFGPQWTASNDLVLGIAIWIFFKSVHIFSPALFTAKKKEFSRLTLSIVIFCLTLSTIIFSFSKGLLFVSYMLALCGIIEFLLTTYFLKRTTAFPIKLFFSLFIKHISIAIIILVAVVLLRTNLEFTTEQYLIECISVGTTALIAWIFLNLIFDMPVKRLIRGFYL